MTRGPFTGGVFHDSIPGGRAAAEIWVTPTEIVAAVQHESSRRLAVPMAECRLDMGGASGRMLFCRTADRGLTIFCEQPEFHRAIDADSLGPLADRLAALHATRAALAHRGRLIAAACLLGLAGLLWGGYHLLPVLAGRAVMSLPLDVDETIGGAAFQSLDIDELDAAHPASRLVTAIVDKLAVHAARPGMTFRAIVARDDQVNAFALPGGRIVVFTGLIKKARTAEQLAGVLAHEMAHTTLRHGLHALARSLGVVAAAQVLIGDMGGLAALGTQAAGQSVLTSYGRGAETEADLEGVRMLHAAAIDPRAMAEFFELLKQEEGDVPDALAWISTHPQHARRIADIEHAAAALPRVDHAGLGLDMQAAHDALD